MGKSEREEQFTIQGYWEGADNTDGTIDLYFTCDEALATTKGMEDVFSGTEVTLNSTAGTFSFSIDNYKYNLCRIKLDMGSMTTLATFAYGYSWER